MSLPTKVKVFDITYEIIYVPEQYMVNTDGDDLSEGEIDLTRHEIRIYKKDQSNEYILSRLWHEIIHAILDGLAFDKKDYCKEEHFVQSLATGINTVLLDNKWIKEDFLSGKEN